MSWHSKNLLGHLFNRAKKGKEGEEGKSDNSVDDSKATQSGYFTLARSWADDIYTTTVASRNRYRVAFLCAMGLSIGLSMAVFSLVPLQHIEPLVVHYTRDGDVWVAPTHQPSPPNNQALTESELVRYIQNRESYDPATYDEQYQLISLTSNRIVMHQYQRSQATSNRFSPIKVLGNKGYRTVHVEAVVFMDHEQPSRKNNKHHANLAEINFTITDHKNNGAIIQKIPLTVLVSWAYRGTPRNPSLRWRNWDGFTITHYRVVQRNV